MMRRFFAAALTVVLLLAMPFSISVFAASNTYGIEELGLRITFPDSYWVVTRDTPADDPVFGAVGMTREDFDNRLGDSIYLDAFTETFDEEFFLTTNDEGFSDFNELSDSDVDAFISMSVGQLINSGFEVSKYDIYQHSQTKFFRVYYSYPGQDIYGVQYYTAFDYTAIMFLVQSYAGSFSSAQEAAIQSIIDSVDFGRGSSAAEEGEYTDPFIYTDTDSGITFTVPANWKQEVPVEGQEPFAAQFVSTRDAGCVILYSCDDIWTPISDSMSKHGYTRSDIGSSFLGKSDIARICDTTADEIVSATYNGIEYFKVELSETSGAGNTATTYLIHVENGWMHMFLFGGTATHALYPEFERMLESAQYSALSDAEVIAPSDSADSEAADAEDDIADAIVDETDAVSSVDTNSEETQAGSGLGIILAVGALLVIVVVVVIVIVIRKKKAPPAAPVSHAPISNAPESPRNTAQPKFCAHCGQALEPGSAFCHNCGQKVN